MQDHPIPTDASPKQKSSKRGCLIAAVVIVVLIILVVAIAGFFIYRFTQTEEGQSLMDSTRAMVEGMQAHGTDELRAMGCDKALVIEMEKFAVMGGFPGVDIPEGKELSGILVVCQASSETTPTCEDAARTYVESYNGSAPHPFAVAVTKEIGEDVECMKYFSSDGTPE